MVGHLTYTQFSQLAASGGSGMPGSEGSSPGLPRFGAQRPQEMVKESWSIGLLSTATTLCLKAVHSKPSARTTLTIK